MQKRTTVYKVWLPGIFQINFRSKTRRHTQPFNMKMYIVLAALMAVAIAAPPRSGASSKEAEILKYENDNIGVDGYKFAYETSDGVSRSESAEIRNLGSDHESIAIRGTISWVDLDGNKFSMDFVADENGFQPQGEHLPH